MNNKQLQDEVATLMLEGYQPTNNAFSWTWMLLSEHLQVRDNLQEELDRMLAGRSPANEVLL